MVAEAGWTKPLLIDCPERSNKCFNFKPGLLHPSMQDTAEKRTNNDLEYGVLLVSSLRGGPH